eukprot:gene5078-10164_t
MNSDWNTLGNVVYRKWNVYDMEWNNNVKIENYRIVGAPFGGPLALVLGDKKSIGKALTIFSASGRKMVEIDMTGGAITAMGWTDLEELAVLLDDGNVNVYNILGKIVRTFLLLDQISATHVVECHFWGNGIVALTTEMQLFVAEGLSTPDESSAPRKYRLGTGLGLDNPYTSMAIIPPLLSRSGLLEVLLGTCNNSIIVVEESDVEDQQLQDRIGAPIIKMAVSPNGRFLACFRRDGILTVMSASFTTKVLDFDTKSMSWPMDIAWCGDDAVVLVWRNMGIVMVGPYGDWLNFPYDQSVFLVSESDCLRVVGSSHCHILQRLPAATEAIEHIGSTDPAALLFDAAEAFENGDPKSDENVRCLATTATSASSSGSSSNQLEEAVQACITAGASEFDIKRQQAFLRAASYGKAFGPNIDPEPFVDTCKALRVLNDVRKANIGLPLTMQQYIRLTPEVLVSRLTIRGHHLLAIKICELLRLKKDRVLINWACEKLKRMVIIQQNTDEDIRDIIQKQLNGQDRISYIEIAAAAYHTGRRRLATMLLDLEANPADQVPLLLSMQEGELALQKAINSEDTDLIYLTLFNLERSKQEKGQDTFHRLVYSHLEAANLLKIYYRHRLTMDDRTLLHSLLIYNKNFLECGIAAIQQAYLQSALPHKIQYVKEASSLFAQGRDLTFFKTMTDEHIELLEIQKGLELRTQHSFVDMSVTETLMAVTMLSVENLSEFTKWQAEFSKIVKKFRVVEKSVYMVKVECFSRAGQWDLLSKLAVEKKSPIGYKPFAMACVKYGQPQSEVEKYGDKIVSSEERYDLYCDLGYWRKAVEIATRLKDQARLQEISRQCRDPQLERHIQDVCSKI